MADFNFFRACGLRLALRFSVFASRHAWAVMLKLFLLVVAASSALLAQIYPADPTSSFPVARLSFLRGAPTSGVNWLHDPSLVVYLPLAVSGGGAAAGAAFSDVSGNRNDGVLLGGASTGGFSRGKVSPLSPYFTHSQSDVVSVPAVAVPAAFTVSAWVSPNYPPAGGYVRVAENDYQHGFYLGSDSAGTHWTFIVANSGGTGCSASVGPVSGSWLANGGSWTMLSASYDGTNERIYVNGVLANTCAWSASAYTLTAKALGVGGCVIASYCGSGSSGSGWFDGAIQDFWIRGRVLSAAEILAIYTAQNR